MKDFRTLNVWQKSHSLTLRIYLKTEDFPKEESYGITSQLRRAVASIPTNIAEGCGRGSDKDFAKFVQISIGSASESEYLILLSKELGYLNNEDYDDVNEKICEIKRMLASLIKNLHKTTDR
ncbi:MAG TPA: four helix bundle protein [Bacteroidales bacterium]|jgi:four helix bundle protein|nr:four helix bundle protein [Bacteroidales bacterium]